MGSPQDRIAAAVDRLRTQALAVDERVDGNAVRWEVNRPEYRLIVYVDLKRSVSLEFDILTDDGKPQLHYWIDTDLYDISQPRHAWFAAEIATDIVDFLDALLAGRLLTRMSVPRPSLIVPTRDGLRIVKRTRFGTTLSHCGAEVDALVAEGYRSLRP
jgi:hypothetical protein